MTIKKNTVRAIELPTCPFCSGAVYYKNWITHRLFQMMDQIGPEISEIACDAVEVEIMWDIRQQVCDRAQPEVWNRANEMLGVKVEDLVYEQLWEAIGFSSRQQTGGDDGIENVKTTG